MRQSGVLLHITSLPSPGGVGTLGRAAYDFVDFVKDSGMTVWQVLPIGPTGYAGSPYQSLSTYAGNPLMIDLGMLEEEGILPEGSFRPQERPREADLEAAAAEKRELLRLAFASSRKRLSGETAAFEESHPWVRDYALFCAVKSHFGGASWMEWPDRGIRLRRSAAVRSYAKKLRDEVEYYIFEQMLFFSQWDRLHGYAKEKGIRLMGDMPIYVAEDSADVWLAPEMFELDDDLRPIRIAGVPPDYFQADGQRWGNPLYAWKKHEETGFSWWISRLKALGDMFDILRIDHFIGFANYYAIPAEEMTARGGKYEIGPGRKLFSRVKKQLPQLDIVAEDLGVVSPRVRKLLAWCGYPGMKVLQFAFDGEDSTDLPEHHVKNCVVYTGTHDNNTTLGWWSGAEEKTKERARKVLGMPEGSDDILPYMLRAAFASAADTVIVPMQDWLGLGGEARMNYPGTVGGNWLWRMQPGSLDGAARRIRRLNRMYRRGTLPAIDADKVLEAAQSLCLAQSHTGLKDASPYQLHEAVGAAAMVGIAPQWADDYAARLEGRRAAYLSAEYLMGRAVYNNLYNMGILDEVRSRLLEKGADLAMLEDIEDAALGNGGLGRLAACFLDSAAAHDIPLTGYGLRYKYGLFRQYFGEDGSQAEAPDDWDADSDPWSVRLEDHDQLVRMEGLTVRAAAYDMPVIGWHMKSVGTLRLWQCESEDEFDFGAFNDQDYAAACRNKNLAEDITKVLYPNDTKDAGKLMRLRQQYVLVSASLQDMLEEYALHDPAYAKGGFARFADSVAVQLNDTHPAMAIPELIRLLTEEKDDPRFPGAKPLTFAQAFDVARRTFRYTNHTVMREALECWDLRLLSKLSAPLVSVIRKIQARLDRDLKKAGVQDRAAYAIIDGSRRVHMARLSVYGSSYTNGVAAIHSRILQDDVFREWYELYPERFNNKTNGITQRRWLGLCDPELAQLLKEALGSDAFLTDLYELEKLRPLIDDELAKKFIAVKREKKRRLAEYIRAEEGVDIPEHFVFDVQVKRLHEYKRQLMNALSILDIYYKLKKGELPDFPATAFIFGAKAAPGYRRAKAVIRFINHIAAMVNADKKTNDRLRVVFVQNYNCSYAERIIPAADISEQISPAGTEASGTGNMKLMLNGAVTLGTRDGANIEIFQEAGEENNYPFGATVEEINAAKAGYDPMKIYRKNAGLRRAVDALDKFEPKPDSPQEGDLAELKLSLLKGASWHAPDHYYVLMDYASYLEAKLRAIRDTRDPVAFAKKCLANIAGAGKFSSDRTVKEYWDELWSR